MDLELSRIFVKVVQNSSFSKAAEILKVPKSTVSKAVSRLEEETGTKLLIRTTRSLTLTASGRAFYEACLEPIHLLEDAQKSLYGQDSILNGLVKITAPEDLGSFVLAPLMAQLTRQHPALNFELKCTDELVDLVKDGFDIAVRIGRVNESSFKIKRVGEFALILVASPKYLKNKEKIKHPKDLQAQTCLSLSARSIVNNWTLRSAKGNMQVAVKPQMASNQMTSLLKMAVADGGVAFVPQYLCQPDIEDGKLVRVLPEWSSSGFPVSIISPQSASSSARLKITIDHIFSSLRSTLQL